MSVIKRMLAVMLAAALALSLTACLSGSEKTITEAPASTEAPADTTPAEDPGTTEAPADTTPAEDDYDPSAPFDASPYCDDYGVYRDIDYTQYVKLADISNIVVPYEDYFVSEEALADSINEVLESHAETIEVKDRAVVDGDTLNIDYVGSVDGVEFAGGSTNGAGTEVTIGVTSYIDDFLEQLIGHMPGENFDIEVTFPDPYQSADLAGKDAVFNITINYIVESALPELTDIWVEENYGGTMSWHNVDEMKAYMTKAMQEDNVLTYLSQYIVDNSQLIEEPQVAKDYWRAYTEWYVRYICNQYGATIEEYLANQGVGSFDELIEKMGDTISTQIEYEMCVQAAGKAVGYEPTEDEIVEYMDSYYGTGYYDYYKDTVPSSTMLKPVINELILQRLAEDVTLEEAPATTP